MTDPCVCGHDGDKHAFTEPTVCSLVGCKCVVFREATPERPVYNLSEKYFEQYKTMEEKMRWILENWKWFRNYTNKDLVLMWWRFIDGWNPQKQLLNKSIYRSLDEPESITRVR